MLREGEEKCRFMPEGDGRFKNIQGILYLSDPFRKKKLSFTIHPSFSDFYRFSFPTVIIFQYLCAYSHYASLLVLSFVFCVSNLTEKNIEK